MDPGEEGLLLHDRGSRLPHDQANHGVARDYADAASYAIPNSATHATSDHSTPGDTACDTSAGDSSCNTSATSANTNTRLRDTGTTSRPRGSFQLRG